MIRVRKSDANKRTHICDVCRTVCESVYIVEIIRGHRIREEKWFCPHCMKELVKGVIDLIQ